MFNLMEMKDELEYMKSFECKTPEICETGVICDSCWIKIFAKKWLKRIEQHYSACDEGDKKSE